MISPIFGKRPKHKEFDYPFRYYDPKEDERRKQRLKIERTYKKKSHQMRSVILLALGLAFIIWVITLL
jgi:hypothetical protein